MSQRTDDARPRWWPIVVGPVVLIVAAFWVALELIQPYTDAGTRAAIIVTVATVAGVLLAAAGLTFGLRQLQLLQGDQRRIADSLGIQPDVHAGFKHTGRPPAAPDDLPLSLDIKPTWSAGQDYSEPFLVECEVHNFGDGSAQQLVTTVALPQDLRVTDVEDEYRFVLKEGERLWICSTTDDFLSPSASVVVPCRIQVPRGTNGVNFMLSFGERDRAPKRVSLHIALATE